MDELLRQVLSYDRVAIHASNLDTRINAANQVLGRVDEALDRMNEEGQRPISSYIVRYAFRVALELAEDELSIKNWVEGIANRYNLCVDRGTKIDEVTYYPNGTVKTLSIGGN